MGGCACGMSPGQGALWDWLSCSWLRLAICVTWNFLEQLIEHFSHAVKYSIEWVVASEFLKRTFIVADFPRGTDGRQLLGCIAWRVVVESPLTAIQQDIDVAVSHLHVRKRRGLLACVDPSREERRFYI